MNDSFFRITLNEIIEGSGEVVVAAWHVSANEMIKKGDDLVEVVTDKASFDVTSPCDGKLVSILKEAGSSVAQGEAIAEIMRAT